MSATRNGRLSVAIVFPVLPPAIDGIGDHTARLAAALTLPVLLQDERLSSFAVEAAIAEGRLPRPRKGQAVDHYAAMVILEDALRALHQ